MFIFVIYSLIIMFIVAIPNQTDGLYDLRVEFDTLTDALNCIRSEIDDVYNHHTIVLYDGINIIGSYCGQILRGLDRDIDTTRNFGPAL